MLLIVSGADGSLGEAPRDEPDAGGSSQEKNTGLGDVPGSPPALPGGMLDSGL